VPFGTAAASHETNRLPLGMQAKGPKAAVGAHEWTVWDGDEGCAAELVGEVGQQH